MNRESHIAQVDIAHTRAPMDDPVMAGFVARLEPLNALADQSPGFVWRVESEEGEVSPVATISGQRVLFNLSVWESIEALEIYIHKSNHVKAVQKTTEWFERPSKSPLELWWIAAGHIPTKPEAERRFESLRQYGPTADAFTFRTRIDPEA